MGIFRQQNALDRLADGLHELRGKIDDLESTSRKLDLEFTELYDKVSRQMSRMAKRYAVDQKENGGDLPPEAPEEVPIGGDPISQSIMLRRGMRGASK